MKNSFLILISIVMFSCSTQKVLKTDTQKDIDLSGRWNNTDAEIATNQLFNSMMTSSWFNDYKADHNQNARIQVEEFETNFNQSGSSLQNYFSKYIQDNQLLELTDKESTLKDEFQLSGSINAEDFINEDQNYIDYILKAQLKDLDGKTLWEDNTVVKKYIKD